MPVSGGGTVTMMKFTMTSQQLSDLDLTVTGTGGSLATAATSASFSGDVVLYATRLTGKLAGVPLTLTPGNAESTLLQLLKSLTPLVPVTLTDVTADQPVVLGQRRRDQQPGCVGLGGLSPPDPPTRAPPAYPEGAPGQTSSGQPA